MSSLAASNGSSESNESTGRSGRRVGGALAAAALLVLGWTLPAGAVIILPEEGQPGDVDGNGSIDIGDAESTFRWLFKGGEPPAGGCFARADVTGDERTDIADGLSLLHFLFFGGPAPTSHGSCSCCTSAGPDIPPAEGITLGFLTQPELDGLPSSTPCRTVYCTVTHQGAGPGVAALSFGVRVEGATIVGATYAGTETETLQGSGFLSDPGEDLAAGGGDRVVAGALLALTRLAVYPPGETSTVLELELAPLPGATGPATLRYEPGLQGQGQPVDVLVVEDGVTYAPATASRSVTLIEGGSDPVDGLTLGFAAPSELHGAAGETVLATCYPTLTHRGSGGTPQGWSYGVRATGGQIVAIDLAGSDAEALLSGGFETHDLTEDGTGAMGAVALSLMNQDLVLPAHETSTLSRIYLEATIPAASGSLRLDCVDGLLIASNPAPVEIYLVVDGTSVRPDAIEPHTIALTPGDPSGDVRFELGFTGPAEVAGPLGGYGRAHVFATLRHEGEAPSAGGWSFGVTAIDPARIAAIDLVGTDAEALEEGGFEKSELTSGAGNTGAVSAVVLSLATEVTLATHSTSTVARLTVDALVRDPGESIALRYADGLRGSGQPVPNRVTRLGATHVPTTTEWWARTALGDLFSRGDTNADGAVDLSDPVATLGYLFLGQAEPPCLDAADSNDDGAVDLSDAMSTLGYLFLGRAEPPPPFGPDPRDACGVDPTEDDLGCDAYAPCEGW